MYIDGTVIVKPKFAFSYNFEVDMHKKLLIAGTDIYFKGVYSLEKNRFIVPCKFGCIFLMDNYIEAYYPESSHFENIVHEDADYNEYLDLVKKNNIVIDGIEYFDYEGNLLDKEEVQRMG